MQDLYGTALYLPIAIGQFAGSTAWQTVEEAAKTKLIPSGKVLAALEELEIESQREAPYGGLMNAPCRLQMHRSFNTENTAAYSRTLHLLA